jgi:glycosyltransferase involved in cell wall biosynthesis
MEFLVGPRVAAFDDEVERLGGTVHRRDWLTNAWCHARAIDSLLRENGPYDVVHCHERPYNAFVLSAAHRLGVPVRIAHSHNGLSHVLAKGGLIKRGYLALTTSMIRRHATVGLAASNKAADSQFGRDWQRSDRFRVLYYGIDLEPFGEKVAQGVVRAELGIPRDTYVVGHVGRFTEQKNHEFLIRVAAELARRDSRCFFLLVGDGPLRPDIERVVESRGLSARFRFAGQRADISRLMLGAMDALVFPSRFEGLPLVLLEAQAGGLPFLRSDNVTDEVDVVPGLGRSLSLSRSCAEWADAVMALRSDASVPSRRDALAWMRRSPFDALSSKQALERVYAEHTGRG